MATHSNILAQKIPWTEEPGGLDSPWGHKESDTTDAMVFLLSRLLLFSVLLKKKLASRPQ